MRPREQTILENWILGALERADTLTPTELAAQLALPRSLVIEVLIGLAECGLIADATDEREEPAELDGPDDAESSISMHLNAGLPTGAR